LIILVGCFGQSTLAQVPDPPYTAAKIVHTPSVSAPESARKTGLGGEVRVGVTIDRQGKVISVLDAYGPGNVCRQVARGDVVAIRTIAKEAAKSAMFEPATAGADRPDVARAFVALRFPVPELASEKASDMKRFTAIGAADAQAGGTSSGLLNGKALVLPRPPYPPAARAVRASGLVNISVLIDEKGEIFSAEAVTGHPLLRAAAKESACGARFTPTLLGGKPVKVAGVIAYNFVP
jgi:outer membrane biosynthesis protein TonB